MATTPTTPTTTAKKIDTATPANPHWFEAVTKTVPLHLQKCVTCGETRQLGIHMPETKTTTTAAKPAKETTTVTKDKKTTAAKTTTPKKATDKTPAKPAAKKAAKPATEKKADTEEVITRQSGTLKVAGVKGELPPSLVRWAEKIAAYDRSDAGTIVITYKKGLKSGLIKSVRHTDTIKNVKEAQACLPKATKCECGECAGKNGGK
jgi:hypothetical protein